MKMNDTFTENDAQKFLDDLWDKLDVTRAYAVIDSYERRAKQVMSKVGEPCKRDENGVAIYG
jgi:hypothetical protein